MNWQTCTNDREYHSWTRPINKRFKTLITERGDLETVTRDYAECAACGLVQEDQEYYI